MPVVYLDKLNLRSSRVFANPIEGGSTSLESLICLPAGYFLFPIWQKALKNVPVVMITFSVYIISPLLILTPVTDESFSLIWISSAL